MTILDAFANNRVEHNWTVVRANSDGVDGKFWMSTDAPKVDGVRATASPRDTQQLADMMRALLPTPKLLDLRHDQARNHIRPSPYDYGQHPNGYSEMMTNSAAVAHGNRVEGMVEDNLGSVSPYGKHWCCGPVVALYGWHVPTAECRFVEGRMSWRRIPCYPTASGMDRWMVLQPYAVGAHLPTYSDYSMAPCLVDGHCHIDGTEWLTEDVYRHPRLSSLVSHCGPLERIRMAGVMRPNGGPQDTAKPRWLDDGLTLGGRAIAWSRAELSSGVRGTPPGSMLHPRIRDYHRPATRRIIDGIPHPDGEEMLLRLDFGSIGYNWCASAACAATWAVASADELASLPHGYRCSGLELWTDAQASGRAKPANDVVAGLWDPNPGDLIVYKRAGWHRHVARYIERTGRNTYRAIAGNESDRWNETDDRKFTADDLVGFISYSCLQ